MSWDGSKHRVTNNTQEDPGLRTRRFRIDIDDKGLIAFTLD